MLFPKTAYSFSICTLALLGLVLSHPAHAAERKTGPWDVARLSEPPAAEWGAKQGLVQQVYFAGPTYRGKATRVFALYARPAEGKGPFPAMVLLHGGGGKAFAEWATLWAERGYAALAIDLAGQGPDGKRLADGGPDQRDTSKFRPFEESEVGDMWTYHAVANALLGHSLLAARPEVDAERIGVTGISWGGYLTCIVAGVDARVKVAVPVYGCGFLHENSYWVGPQFDKMPAEQRERWVKHFDPSNYLPGVRCPILFVNGTNDFAYPLDSYQKSYEQIDAKLRHLCVTVNMPHGHSQGWAPREIGLFVDSVLRDGKALPVLTTFSADRSSASATFNAAVPLVAAHLHYTTDDGPWQKRGWTTKEAMLDGSTVRAALPPELVEPKGVYFLTVRDERGAVISTPHCVIAP